MLAYVFWHRKMDHVRAVEYEASLVEFHKALMNSKVNGYLGSIVSRIEGAPWMMMERSGYEDWYCISNSEVIDALNQSAVTGISKNPHDSAARMAVDMHAGLYESKNHFEGHLDSEWAIWFSKPAGTEYSQLYAEIEALSPDGESDLWRRRMVLGPTPEFCLLAKQRIEIPESMKPIQVKRKVVWNGISI